MTQRICSIEHLKGLRCQKKLGTDPFCKNTSTFGQTNTEPKIEYVPIHVEESSIISGRAQQPNDMEHSDMVHTKDSIIVSTLSSIIKVEQEQISESSNMTRHQVATSRPKKAAILTTEINTDEANQKRTEKLAVELKVKDNIAAYCKQQTNLRVFVRYHPLSNQ